jgi:hypothetical protein
VPDALRFGKRTALVAGCPTFAGVETRLRSVLQSVGGLTTTNSVSVVGPRQSGRSSLLRQLAHEPYYSRVQPLQGATFVHADFRDLKGQPDGAVRLLITRIAEALEQRSLPAGPVRDSSTMCAAVEAALRVVPGRLVVLIDDFEQVGSDLRRDHQADLRQAVYSRPRAGYVIATRLPLQRCLEEFGDPLSDLAPICNPLPEAIWPLDPRDIASAVSAAFGMDRQTVLGPRAARYVYERVGGHPLWVQQALSVLEERGLMEQLATPEAPLQADENVDRAIIWRLEDTWSAGLRQLSHDALSALSQGGKSDRVTWKELVLGGWADPGCDLQVRPAGCLVGSWLSEGHWRSGTPTLDGGDDPYSQLVFAVEALNQRYQRCTGKPREKLIRPEVFTSGRDSAFLRRTVSSRKDFDDFVGALARLLNEGTQRGPGVRTLPQFCYEDPRSIVRQAMTLRNPSVHIEPYDPTEAERILQAQIGVYQRYLGIPDPSTSGEFGRLAAAMLEEAVDFLRRATQFCPFAPDLSADALLNREARSV